MILKRQHIHQDWWFFIYLIPGWIGIWNVGFWGAGKTRVPGKKRLRSRERINKKLNTHIWRWCRDLYPCHFGRRRVLSPLHHPYHPPPPQDVQVTDEPILFVKNVNCHSCLLNSSCYAQMRLLEMTRFSGDWYLVSDKGGNLFIFLKPVKLTTSQLQV